MTAYRMYRRRGGRAGCLLRCAGYIAAVILVLVALAGALIVGGLLALIVAPWLPR